MIYVYVYIYLYTFLSTDKEPPVTTCPKNVNITSDFATIVFWGQGYATDNVGIASLVFNPPNGTKFDSDTKNTVVMTVTDVSGNNASCVMEVLIKGMILDFGWMLCNILKDLRVEE